MIGPEHEPQFAETWKEARQGSEEARAQLLEAVRNRILSFLTRRMGAEAKRRSDVEDLAQNALLDLHCRMDRFPDDMKSTEFLSYALQIARWRLGDLMKNPQRMRGSSEMPAREVASPLETGIVTREDERQFCREQLQFLSESDRAVIEAFHLRGLTVAEIARELLLDGNVVKQRLVRGRRRLRELISKGRSAT